MKKIYVVVLALVAALIMSCENRQTPIKGEASASPETSAQPEAPAELAAFSFEETSHDFGTIKQGDVVKHVFKFTNSGKVPLVITSTQVTCGCTTPEYTKEPIPPGGSGELVVQFNSAGKMGVQNKQVTIYANVPGGTSAVSILTNVDAEPEVAGPFKK